MARKWLIFCPLKGKYYPIANDRDRLLKLGLIVSINGGGHRGTKFWTYIRSNWLRAVITGLNWSAKI
jgi:hypothetical protein